MTYFTKRSGRGYIRHLYATRYVDVLAIGTRLQLATGTTRSALLVREEAAERCVGECLCWLLFETCI